MTKPVPNLQQRLVDKNGFIDRSGIWNLWFQSFAQAPQAIENITVGASPFDYTPNNVGTVFITSGTVSDVSLIRGSEIISLGNVKQVLVSLKDTVRITYSVLPTVRFAEL